jgi:protein-disulfide isomerase
MITPNRRDTLSLGLTLGAGAGLLLVSPAKAKTGASGPDPRDLTHDPDQPVLGNPDGDVTLVEFFDYQCPYCRQSHPATMDFVAADGNLRLVLRDWPIFGPVSDRAVMVALGAVALGKYPQIVDAMMALGGRRLSDADIDGATAAAGLTPEAALRSFQNDYDKWTALVGRNMGMAQMLGLNGTPSYVVGRDLFPGVTPIPVLRRAVEAARKG